MSHTFYTVKIYLAAVSPYDSSQVEAAQEVDSD